MIPFYPDPTIDTILTIFLSALILVVFGWLMYSVSRSNNEIIPATSNNVPRVLPTNIVPKKTREEQFQEMHNKYFRGQNSRIGRAIKYIEENKRDV